MKKIFRVLLCLCMLLLFVSTAAFAEGSCDQHSPGEAVIENEVPAGCDDAGSCDTVVYCTDCGEELSREPTSVPQTAHSYEEETTPPTHTEDGYTTYTCSLCGDSYTGDEVAATGHDSDSEFIYYENGDGTHEVYCIVCEEYVRTDSCAEFDADHKCVACGGPEQLTITFMNGDREWASITHAYGCSLGIAGMPVPQAAAGMKFAGWYTQDDVFVYHGMTVTTDLIAYATWKAESYTVTWISDGETYEAASVKGGDPIEVPEEPTKEGFHFVRWDTEIPAAMPEENLTITAVWEACYGGTATCTERALCFVCGEAYGAIDGTNHTYGDWTVVKAATETAKGEKQRSCLACGHVESMEIPLLANIPATGDTSNVLLYGGLFLLSLGAITVLLPVSEKRRRDKA